MRECEYYRNYRGPELVSCWIDTVDYTERIREFYGPQNNWQGNLWTYEELFGLPELSEKLNQRVRFKIEYRNSSGTFWEYGFVSDPKQFYNPKRFV